MQTDDHRGTLLLSVDFEDWHQLVRRRVGVADWERPGPALPRQTEATLRLLDDLGVRATFFILGMTARAHPALVEAVAAQGHEVGCHGDAHLPVRMQTRDEFAGDLRAACATIEGLTGQGPIGYRAPAFSITPKCPWAHEVLAAEGFAYDASEHDTPRIRGRAARSTAASQPPSTDATLGDLFGIDKQIAQGVSQRHPSQATPYPLELPSGTLWEFPVAVWRPRPRARIPVGGASYWAMMPTSLVLRGLRAAAPMAGLYLHPHELDPQPLDALLPRSATPAQRVHGAVRAAQRNLPRRRASEVLRAIAGRHRLIPYGEAHAEFRGGTRARS